MSFLTMSGLKKAYESLGGEITRTFDSSQTEDGQAVEVESSGPPAPLQDGTESPDGEEFAARREGEGGGEDWGEWEEQGKGRTTVAATKTTTPLPSTTQSPPTSILAGGPNVPSPLTTSTPARSSGSKVHRGRREGYSSSLKYSAASTLSVGQPPTS